jgi:hypothetical protein
MLMAEEERVIAYLRGKGIVSVDELARVCLPSASPEWQARVLANLVWLGYVVVYPGPDGRPGAIQATELALTDAVM